MESLAWDPVHCRLASAGDGLPCVWNLTPESKLPPHHRPSSMMLTVMSETLTSIISQPDKQPYVARTVHFYDNGASLLVSFLESGEMSVCVVVTPSLSDPSADSAILSSLGI